MGSPSQKGDRRIFPRLCGKCVRPLLDRFSKSLPLSLVQNSGPQHGVGRRQQQNQGNGFTLAETGGVETVTLTISQTPAHSHAFLGSTNVANSANPTGNVVGQSPQVQVFSNFAPDTAMATNFLSSVGGSQPHDNFQPYLCVDFIISLFGVFPSQT